MFVFCSSCCRNILKQTLSEYNYLYFYGWSIILTSSGKRTEKFDRTQGLYSRKRYSSKSKWSAEHEWIHFCRLLLIPYREESRKNNNIPAVQAETSKFASLSFDQGVQIVINPSSVVYVPELIGTPSDNILHRSDCCLLCQ